MGVEMTESFFDRVVVPVANRDDAAATVATLRPYFAADSTVIAVHVIEKAGGAPYKASVESLSEKCLFCRKICLIKSITVSKVVKLARKLFFGQALEQLELRAEEIFSIITEGFNDTNIVLETDLRYGTDIASAIVGAAHDRCASAILFTPRGGSRWRKLLTGDVTHNLVRSSDIPILVLPDREETELSSSETNQTEN